MFNSDNTWDIPTHTTSLTAAAQMTAADIAAAAQWSRLNNFRIDWALQRGGELRERHPGDCRSPAGPIPGHRPGHRQALRHDFGWMNHTWDHATLDQGCATANYIEAELNQNTAFATAPAGSGGLGGLGLTPDPNGTSNGYGTFDVHAFVPGEHSGLANLIPGATASIDAVRPTAAAGGSGGTLAAGTYNYAVTAQYIYNTGDSQSQTSSVTVAAGQTVSLNWTGICKAASYRVYRQDPGSATWNVHHHGQPARPATLDPTTTTDVAGGGMAPVSYTDTGTAGTSTTFVPSLTATTALEFPYEQNQSSTTGDPGRGDHGRRRRRLKALPQPADDGVRHQHDHAVHRRDIPGRAVVRRRARARRPAPPDQHLLQHRHLGAADRRVQHDLPRHQLDPGQHHQPGRIGDVQHDHQQRPRPVLRAPDQPGRRILQQLGAHPGAHPVRDAVPQRLQRGRALRAAHAPPGRAVAQRQQAWAAAVAAGTVTATEQGGTIVIKNTGAQIDIPINAPTGTLVEPGGTPFGSAYAGSVSDWVTVPAGGTYNLQAPAAPYVTTQPVSTGNIPAGGTATFTAAATNGQSNPPASVQWYVSTDNGLTWNPVAGATSTTLTLTGVTGSMNNSQYEAIFTNSLGSATSNPATLAVNHTNPTATAPTASAITFGQTLGSSTLSGGAASVPGTWSFDNPSQAPSAGTLLNVPITFTPSDTGSYNPVHDFITVQVNKATPYLTTLSKPLTYGQALSSTPLLINAFVRRGGAQLRGGSIVIQNSKFKPNAGKVTETVSYIPADSADFNSVTETIVVTVNKAHPKLSATVKTRKPVGGKAMSVMLTGLQKGAREQLVVQNSHRKTQTVVRFVAKGATLTINIKLTGAHRRRLGKGNYRVVIVQSATSNTYAGSSSVRKFKIVR